MNNKQKIENVLKTFVKQNLISPDVVKSLVSDLDTELGKSSVEQVQEFHETMGLTVGTGVDYNISQQDIKLRLNLIVEEVTELAIGLGEEDYYMKLLISTLNEVSNKSEIDAELYDPVDVLDALADIRYVVDGTAVTFGMHYVYEDAISEVHRSNMSKACKTEEEVEATIEAQNGHRSGYMIYKMGLGPKVVKRKRDGKVIKSINYSPANLKQFINE